MIVEAKLRRKLHSSSVVVREVRLTCAIIPISLALRLLTKVKARECFNENDKLYELIVTYLSPYLIFNERSKDQKFFCLGGLKISFFSRNPIERSFAQD